MVTPAKAEPESVPIENAGLPATAVSTPLAAKTLAPSAAIVSDIPAILMSAPSEVMISTPPEYEELLRKPNYQSLTYSFYDKISEETVIKRKWPGENIQERLVRNVWLMVAWACVCNPLLGIIPAVLACK